MSLFTFPIESAFSNISQVSAPADTLNTSMLEASQLLPSLQSYTVSVPTTQEIEQLSFFDEWIANDCNEVVNSSGNKLATPIDDFEITPIDDTFNSQLSFDFFGSPLIDSSVSCCFPSPESLTQLGFLPEMTTDITLTSFEPTMTPSHLNYNVQQESPVNVQLPSPAQTPQTSPVFLKQVTQEASSSTVAAGVTSGVNKRPCSDESDTAIAKRQKNTDAARRSRQRKAEKIHELDKRTSELLVENTRLNTKVAILESEKKHQRQKELELQIRIQTLENQLAEAHRILTDC